jgi:small-conductance mechanosensitive channel
MQTLLHSSLSRFIDGETGISFIGNALSRWVWCLVIAVVVFALLKVLFRLVSCNLERLAKRTTSHYDDVLSHTLSKTRFWFFGAIALFCGLQAIDLGKYEFLPLKVLTITTFLQIGLWGSTAFGLLSHRLAKNAKSAQVLIRFTGEFVVWVLVGMLVLDNLGVKVASLLAGLGIGGIAVALAVQKVLGDLLASASIMLDKPFEPGDFITTGSFSGTVEEIGLKSTRIRANTGEQVVISNSDLLESRIQNFRRMNERRVNLSLGVTYQTTPENLRKVVGLVKGIIEAQELARYDRGHLSQFGDSSINYEFVYWITRPDYLAFMDTQQTVNLAITDAFATHHIDFAYPTQTVYVASESLPSPSLV